MFAIIIVIYTIMGGFTSVATNDLIQSIVMSIALISIVTFGVSSAGGFGAVMDNAKSLPGYFSLSAIHDAVAGTAVIPHCQQFHCSPGVSDTSACRTSW